MSLALPLYIASASSLKLLICSSPLIYCIFKILKLQPRILYKNFIESGNYCLVIDNAVFIYFYGKLFNFINVHE